jgi:hypothetical protein
MRTSVSTRYAPTRGRTPRAHGPLAEQPPTRMRPKGA